ncbi:cell surface protein precursor [Lactiplantibacillus plantarum]|nr:cell surface protein precursor [Lactiplantibacillus plantarum]MCG0624122.1 cell surface protein precursor [Lactiplantibacillus plantarum]MCG0751108.1 cell surface protein precursor [Lactiplantibacillus plantarum]MCG0760324.1 cell surface protein precursor [Lactiplantibacillus plantarum]MCG0765414.1 cell surface protein precursor [Lactiplantibacillus plantarum]
MNIANQYSYVIGLKYTAGIVPQPQLKLDTITAGMQNYRRGVFPQLRNVTAVIVPKLTITAMLTSKNSGKVIKNFTQKNVQLAPNSVYKVPILTGTNRLQAGSYHVRLVAKNTDHRWVFDKDFVISTAAADKYNQASVDNSGMSVGWFILFGALGMLIIGLIGLLIFFWIKKRRRA